MNSRHPCDIAVALQRGIPIEPRPFAALAGTLGVSEADVLAVLRGMLEDGSARRFGAVFDARRLGYRSELCAIDVPEADVEVVGARVAAHTGVTHAYLRGHPEGLPPFPDVPGLTAVPNLWFTLAVLHNRFEREFERLQRSLAGHAVLRLPAVRRFKIDVIFDPARREEGERIRVMAPKQDEAMRADEGRDGDLSESQRVLVRALQGTLPAVADVYAAIAKPIGWTPDAVIAQLSAWQQTGTLRRISMVVRHQRIGFTANAMCVWPVPEPQVITAGRRLAEWSDVTHCYQRLPRKGWPFTLYAMIHTGSWEATRRLFERLGDDTGLIQGRLLGSLREFKKTSMRYFGEECER